MSIRRSAGRGTISGWRRAVRTTIASAAAGTARPTPTTSGLNDASAARVAGNVTLKHSTPTAPSSMGDAFRRSREVLLLDLMNNDSSVPSATAAIEALVTSLPPDSRLPSYRELQIRYRLSPATVQRMLADLGRRGLVVTRPGSGTFTAGARPSPAPVPDVSWQTLALGSRSGLGPDLERLVEPPPPDALPLASGFLDESLQPLGLLAAAASRAARRPQGWSRLPSQGLPELRSFLAGETGAAMTAQNVLITPGGQAALSAVFRHLCAPTGCCRTPWPTRSPAPEPGSPTSSRGSPTRRRQCSRQSGAGRCWTRSRGAVRSWSRTTGSATLISGRLPRNRSPRWMTTGM